MTIYKDSSLTPDWVFSTGHDIQQPEGKYCRNVLVKI